MLPVALRANIMGALVSCRRERLVAHGGHGLTVPGRTSSFQAFWISSKFSLSVGGDAARTSYNEFPCNSFCR